MNKIWIPAALFVLIIAGGFLYNGYVSGETDEMLELSEKAYDIALADSDKCMGYIDEIDKNINTVKSKYRRALLKLKHLLKEKSLWKTKT